MIVPMSYREIYGKLFKDGVSIDDVWQGNIGNCWIVSTIAAMAKHNAAFIRSKVQAHPDGTYKVSYYKRVWYWPFGVKRTVTVDNKVLLDGAATRLDTNDPDIWFPIMEKAYAASVGGYENIMKGGVAYDVFDWLTGRMPKIFWSANKVSLKDIEENAGKPMVAETAGFGFKPIPGLIKQHAYAVLGVDNGKVVIFNPWGHTEVGSDGVDDGFFKLTIEQFRESFARFYVCRYKWFTNNGL